MPWFRRSARGLVMLAAAALVMTGCASETASPQDVIRDFDWDGLVDGQWDADPQVDVRHTVSDLERAHALMAVQQPGLLAAFSAATKTAIDQGLLGIIPTEPAGPAGQPDVKRVDVPTWAVVTAGGAGLLVVAGLGSALFRRSRRRVATPRGT